MQIQILDKTKKKKIVEELEHFGIEKIPQLLVRSGTERIRAYSRHLSNDELMDLWRILPIEGVGLYVGKELIDRHGVREVRLSVDGLHMLKDQIVQDTFTLTEKQEEEWFLGKNLDVEGQKDGIFVAVLSADGKDFVGMGKIGNGGKVLYNYLPKERQRRVNVITN